jgi:hypothetical protein
MNPTTTSTNPGRQNHAKRAISTGVDMLDVSFLCLGTLANSRGLEIEGSAEILYERL